MSEEIKEMNPDDKNHKKDSDGYEKICYLCHRPVSKVDKMITIPNQITICSDCMQKTFDQIGMQGKRRKSRKNRHWILTNFRHLTSLKETWMNM